MEYCPICGTRRVEGEALCHRCGLDYPAAEAGHGPIMLAPGGRRTAPGGWGADQGEQPPSRYSMPPVPQPRWQQPQPMDFRPVSDRQNMAKLTAHALDIRCGGTAGGCLGMLAGFTVGALVGAAAGLGPGGSLVLAVFGMFLGMFLGMRIALGMMAR